MDAELHSRCVNTIKGLSMDAIQKANSGHPGMPMGMASAATVLWTRFLKFDPDQPDWADRDRFVLSAGHGSMLLYSLLHLSGYDLTLDDLKDFRQWGSKTPGHPEVGHTPGVETTTGPLGQGFATAVGMAVAERTLRETFGAELCDHWTYGICGDGDLMEGIAAEAASFAGHLGLGRLVFLYDDNKITIDGGTDIAFTEDVCARMEAQGWHVQRVDGHDPEAVASAIEAARRVENKPSLIACRTVIGQGSPSFEGTSRTHGAPLGVDEIRATKERLGMDPDVDFATSAEVYSVYRGAARPDLREAWEERVAASPQGDTFRRWLSMTGEDMVQAVDWPSFPTDSKLATRKASAACLKAIVAANPNVIGGSADLAGSNGTRIGGTAMTRERFAGASTIHFGIREHAMGAICNGMVLHGGMKAYNATFLVFHDYQRSSLRLSALMKQPVIYIYTHDSVFLGEDGPTHQPIATLLSIRALPNVQVIRPADAAETAEAWKMALAHDTGPTALILSRQGLPELDHVAAPVAGVHRGAYTVLDVEDPQVLLLGTGSEVSTCVQAAALLKDQGVRARVVSLPCRELFLTQSEAYRASVFPAGVPRLSVEAGVTLGWERWTGAGGGQVGVDHFGASAPASVLAEQLGLTPAAVAAKAKALLSA